MVGHIPPSTSSACRSPAAATQTTSGPGARGCRPAGHLRSPAEADRPPAALHRPLPGQRPPRPARPRAGSRPWSAWRLSPPPASIAFPFRFRLPANLPDPAAGDWDAAAGYGGTADLTGISLTLRPAAGSGLLGRNGAGKSTWSSCCRGCLPMAAGERGRARRPSAISPSTSWNNCAPTIAPAAPDAARTDHAGAGVARLPGRFRFPRRYGDPPGEPFSGGEKSRLALALLIRTRPNPAAARRTDQPIWTWKCARPDLRLQDEGGVVRRLARPPPAAHLRRRTLAGRRRRRRPSTATSDDYAAWLAAQRAAGRRWNPTPPHGNQRARPAAAEAGRQPPGPARPAPAAGEGEIEQLEPKLARGTRKGGPRRQFADPPSTPWTAAVTRATRQPTKPMPAELAGRRASGMRRPPPRSAGCAAIVWKELRILPWAPAEIG